MTAVRREDTKHDPNNPVGNPGVAGSAKRPDRPEDEDPTHPGQLNRDNVNPNAKHANPPPPASGEMLSINEPPGSQLNPAQSAASDEQAQGGSANQGRPKPQDDDDDDDDGGKKAKRHR